MLRVSYLEIYNEVIRDLLTPGSTNLKIHETPEVRHVYVDFHITRVFMSEI